MAKKCNKYLIMATGNDGSRRTLHSYKTKAEATKQVKIILSKPKGNKTSYRNAQSGV